MLKMLYSSEVEGEREETRQGKITTRHSSEGEKTIFRVRWLLLLLWTIMFVFVSSSCGLLPSRNSTSTAFEPQPGEWAAQFSIKLDSGKTENWEVYFEVSDDSKTVPSIRLLHYIGDLTPSTEASVLYSLPEYPIENNSFEISLSEYVSYSVYDYDGSVTFTSSREARMTMNVYGDDYQCTAVPTSG